MGQGKQKTICYTGSMTRGGRLPAGPVIWVLSAFILFNIVNYATSPFWVLNSGEHAHVATAPCRALPASTVPEETSMHTHTSRTGIDDDPIHIAHAYCAAHGQVDEADNGLTVVRSILMARENGESHNRRYVFHIVADDIIGRALRESVNASHKWSLGEFPDRDTFDRKWGDIFRYISGTGGRVSVRLYSLGDLDAALWAALGPSAHVR